MGVSNSTRFLFPIPLHLTGFWNHLSQLRDIISHSLAFPIPSTPPPSTNRWEKSSVAVHSFINYGRDSEHNHKTCGHIVNWTQVMITVDHSFCNSNVDKISQAHSHWHKLFSYTLGQTVSHAWPSPMVGKATTSTPPIKSFKWKKYIECRMCLRRKTWKYLSIWNAYEYICKDERAIL